jgi:hypothetical protein
MTVRLPKRPIGFRMSGDPRISDSRENLMLHEIAMNKTITGKLNLGYIGTGNLWVYNQDFQGVWSNPIEIPRINLAPPPNPQVNPQKFVGLVGVDGAGFLARDKSGLLWSTTQGGDEAWTQGFWPVVNAWRMCSDFSVAEVEGFPLLFAAIGTLVSGDPDLLYTQVGILYGSSQSNPLPMLGSSAFGYTAVSVAGIDPRSGSPENDTPTAVVFVSNKTGRAPRLACFISSDPNNGPDSWQPARMNSSAESFTGDVVALVSGNPNGTLHEILLDAYSVPHLLVDQSGKGTQWGSVTRLPMQPNGLKFSKLADVKGVTGTLEVVGISEGLPYLTSQDANGTWHPYADPQGDYLPLSGARGGNYARDPAMGIGYQGTLQVGYIADQGIYLNWLDQTAVWQWYGPLARI